MKTLAILIVSCFALHAHALVGSEMESAAKSLGASTAEEVSFKEGTAQLTDSAKDSLRNVMKSAKENGTIEQVKVIAWADREYPVKGTKAPKEDVKLANERIQSIKRFLKADQNVADVSGYNMTQRPNGVQKWLNTPQASVKDTLENTGAAPRTNEETGLFGHKAQASRAVLMVYVRKE